MRGIKAIVCLAVSLCACGKSNSLVDGNLGDGGSGADASIGPDANASGPVTVTVLLPDQSGNPDPNVPVVFINPSGAVAAETKTDTNGQATATIDTGATVTVVYVLAAAPPMQTDLETVMGLKPGDQITIGSKDDHTDAGNFTVNLLVDPTPNIDSYTLYGPCGSVTYQVPPTFRATGLPIPMTLDMANDCMESTMDLVAVAFFDGQVTDYVHLPGVAFTAGGSTTQGADWQPIGSLALSFTDVPDDVNPIYPDVDYPDYLTYQDGTTQDQGYSWSNGTTEVSGGSIDLTFPVPIASHALVDTTITNDSINSQEVYEVIDGTASTYSLDVAKSLLPWISMPMVDYINNDQVMAPTLPGALTPDAFYMQIQYQRPDSGGGGGGSGTPIDQYTWTFWGANADTFNLPQLPTDLATDMPTMDDTAVGALATLYDLSLVSGYDEVRGKLDQAFSAYLNGRGATGTLHVSTSASAAELTGMMHRLRGPHISAHAGHTQRAR